MIEDISNAEKIMKTLSNNSDDIFTILKAGGRVEFSIDECGFDESYKYYLREIYGDDVKLSAVLLYNNLYIIPISSKSISCTYKYFKYSDAALNILKKGETKNE